MLLLKVIEMEDHSGIEEVDCYDPSTHRFAHVKGTPEKELLAEFNRGTIISGESTLMLDGAYFDEENGSLVIGDLVIGLWALSFGL